MSEVVINVTKVEEVVTINATPNVTQILVNTNSGGGGAVNSVFGRSGNVTAQSGDYETSEITESTNKKFVTDAEKTAITHSNRSILDAITESFTTALKNAYDGASAWVTDVGLQLKTDFDALIATGSRLITTTEITKLSNTSGTNSGDNTTNTTSNAYADAKVEDAIVNGVTTKAPSQNAVFDALALKVDKTSWIDISATSTIVGWSSFTQKSISYKITDGTLECVFYLEGTSNSTSVTFTLPNNSAQGFSAIRPSGYNVNNTVVLTNSARILITNGTNVVTITRDFTGLSWTASGTKGIAGQISFKI